MPRRIVIIALALSAAAALVLAGPLTPPAGPVASSFKTLGEVEPRIAITAANTPGAPTNSPGSADLACA